MDFKSCTYFFFFTLISNYRWGLCPDGYYLNGMRIGGKYWIHLIEEAKCCRPEDHFDAYKDCYDEEGGSGWKECTREGYYVAGIYRGSCDKFECLEWLKCCSIHVKTGDSVDRKYFVQLNL